MIVLLNGPLGIGKSTLAEALAERIDGCVMLDGDAVVAANPAPADPGRYLHETLALLVSHHRKHGYRHFVINHFWPTAAALADLQRTLGGSDEAGEIRPFRLTLPLEDHLVRIARRQAARAIDEREFEDRTAQEEREILDRAGPTDVGEPLDVSGPLEEVVARMLASFGVDEIGVPRDPVRSANPLGTEPTRVRSATPADAEAAMAVVRASIAELCVTDHGNDAATLERWLANKTPTRFRGWVADPDHHCVVAVSGGSIQGVGLVRRTGEVLLFYVAPGRQRGGVGRLLHEALETRAREWALSRLFLDSTSAARPFYESLGYRTEGSPKPVFGTLVGFPYVKAL